MSPLAGIKVVDLTRYLSGPMASMLLADLGADVVKVEALPHGDPSRQSGPFVNDGESAYYMASNRNKRSLAVDLRSDAGAQILRRLLADADVLIENFRPGTASAMGIGPEDVAALNPRIVYASISGFGSRGPGATLPGFDQTVQAMSGLMSITGTEETGPLRTGIAIADAGTGVLTAFGIAAALMERERTGVGTMVEASLMQSMMALINYQAQITLSLGLQPQLIGNDHPIMFPQGTFATADGAVTIACGNARMWGSLCAALEREELVDHADYQTNELRLQNRKPLRRTIEETLSTHPSDVWIERINASGVPCGPVLTLEQALTHPTSEALGLVQQVEHPTIGPMSLLGTPIRIGDDSTEIKRHPPLKGEHSAEILAEAGYSDGEISNFIRDGVIETT